MKKRLTDEEEQTLKSYNANAKQWAQGHSDQDFWIEERKLFRKYLPKGKVLEVGAGGGRDAQKLISLGYDYVGTDISEGLLEVARENNPGATFLAKSVYDLDFPEDSFDGFWASAVLLHVPKDSINLALQNIKKVIKADGIGFISMKQGEDELLLEEDRGVEGKFKRLFVFYSLDEFNKVLVDSGFEVLHSRVHPPEGKTIWLTYIVKVT